MKKGTKKTLGAGLLLTSVILGVVLYKRSKQPSTSGLAALSPNQAKQARLVRQFAKRMGRDLTPKPVVVEKVLPNGMTQSFARKYVGWLNDRSAQRGTKYTHKHISPSSLALPVDQAVR